MCGRYTLTPQEGQIGCAGAAIVEQAGLPPEYPTVVAQPQDRYLQILVLRLR